MRQRPIEDIIRVREKSRTWHLNSAGGGRLPVLV